MNKPLQIYCKQEKQEGMIFLVVGFLALSIAALNWILLGDDFPRGMAVSLALMGVIELVIGVNSYVRSDQQLELLSKTLSEDPTTYVKQERQRMLRQLRNYDLYRWTGLTLCLVGLAILLASMAAGGEAFWTGLGTGLFLQSTVMLVLDLLAERRAGRYMASIEDLNRKLSRKKAPSTPMLLT